MKSFFSLTMIIAVLFLTSPAIAGIPKSPVGYEIKVGKAAFIIPAYFHDEKPNENNSNDTIIFGTMDEREICYLSYFAIFASQARIPDSALVAAPAYKVKSIKSTALSLKNASKAVQITLELTAEKPCGRIVDEQLNAVQFYDKKSRTWYAISGFFRPRLTFDALFEVAKSIH